MVRVLVPTIFYAFCVFWFLGVGLGQSAIIFMRSVFSVFGCGFRAKRHNFYAFSVFGFWLGHGIVPL